MKRSIQNMQALAEQLIACEAKGLKSSRKRNALAFPVTGKLRPHLATLMGNGGYRALLMRALALAGAEVAWLRAVRVDGQLQTDCTGLTSGLPQRAGQRGDTVPEPKANK